MNVNIQAMCWSKEVSITTYILGLIGCVVLYNTNHKPEAIFYGWVIHMQLIEYFLWSYQPCVDPMKSKNEQVTKAGILVNHLEPIIFWLALMMFPYRQIPSWVTYWMVMFVVVTMVYTKRVYNTSECTTVTEESAPHLQWKWNNENYGGVYYTIFLATLVILSLYGIGGRNGNINAILAVASFALSYIMYGDKKVVGAMWCWFAAMGPYGLLMLYK